MLGGKTVKVKIDRDLHDRLRKVADVAGYATAEEFITHVLEKEMLHFEDAGSDDDIRRPPGPVPDRVTRSVDGHHLPGLILESHAHVHRVGAQVAEPDDEAVV